MVGKNEAGKTALLQALCCLNSLDPERGKLDPVEDYPRKFDGEYRNDLEAGNREPAVVVRGTFELNDEDVKAIEEVFGAKVLKQPILTLSKNYENKRTYSLQIDEAVTRENVVKAAKLSADAQKALRGSDSWEDLNAEIADVEPSEELEKLKQFLAGPP